MSTQNKVILSPGISPADPPRLTDLYRRPSGREEVFMVTRPLTGSLDGFQAMSLNDGIPWSEPRTEIAHAVKGLVLIKRGPHKIIIE